MKMNPAREAQEKVFRSLYQRYQGSSMAVSSESWAHKTVRFSQMSRIFEGDNGFTIHDVGMGMADYYAYLRSACADLTIEYSGTEILQEYYDEASRRFPSCKFYLRDIAEQSFDDCYDYVVMSGVFHQRRDTRIRDWEVFAQDLIMNSFRMCNKAVGFNFISPFVDYYQTEVYYCNLPKLLNFINDNLSRFFVINHNYALFEFTVFVYKESYVKLNHPQSEFQKYFRT